MTRLAQISDLHFGAQSPGLADALADHLNSLSLDVIIASGDFTQYGRSREFEQARHFFEALNAPVVGTPGNHDTPYLNVPVRALQPWGRYYKTLGKRVQPRWNNHDTAVDTLLTARGLQMRPDWSLGRANPKHAQALGQTLQSFDGVKIVTAHHPLTAPGGLKGQAKTTRGADSANQLVKHGVDLVLTGHLHKVFALPKPCPDGTTCWFVGAGTALSHRTRGEPPSFNLFETDSKSEGVLWQVHAALGGHNRFTQTQEQELPF